MSGLPRPLQPALPCSSPDQDLDGSCKLARGHAPSALRVTALLPGRRNFTTALIQLEI
jgi:hypothetical protein